MTHLLEEDLTQKIIGAAIAVHRYWRPGLYEQIYEKSLCRELELCSLAYQRQIALPLIYRDQQVGDDLRLDLCVEGKVVVENKHIEDILPVHMAQLMTYMKLTGCRVGLLFNYRTQNLTQSMRRLIL